VSAPKRIEIEVGSNEDAQATYARDQLLVLRCMEEGVARARVWRRPQPGLSLGRFHRADPASCAVGNGAGSSARTEGEESSGGKRADAPSAAARGGLSRRLSGGRITMAVPVVDWLDPAAKALRPEQVLNRAIRPLLAMLRGDGVEAFYPGRDLVTVGGRPIAHLSFTVMRDGAAVVEMHVAETPAFATLAALLDRDDPAGIAGVDRDALAGATSLQEETADAASKWRAAGSAAIRDAGSGAESAALRGAGSSAESTALRGAGPGTSGAARRGPGRAESWTLRSDEEWASRFATFAAPAFECEAVLAAGGDAGDVTMADAAAAADFLASPGPLEEGAASAAAVSMLGVVECSGRLRGDRLTGLAITGDLIAPFHTIDDIAAECEGEPLRPDYIRKALARAMAQPRSFLLGLRELDELILRIA
jgi:hypothetical protein